MKNLNKLGDLKTGILRGKKKKEPQHEQHRDKKGKQYFLDMMYFVISEYFNNVCLIPFDGNMVDSDRTVDELRAYAKGRQSPKKYQPLLVDEQSKNKGASYMNISWKPPGIIPKFRSVVLGMMKKTDFDITTIAVDPQAEQDKNIEKEFLKFSVKPSVQKMAADFGIQPPQRETVNNITLRNGEDVDAFFEMGGFRLQREIASTAAINASFYQSRWGVIKNKIHEDLFDLGIALSKTYEEKLTGIVKHRYVDPKYFVGRYTKYPDKRNMDYGGELRPMTISEIIRESNLSEEEIAYLSRNLRNYSNRALSYDDYEYSGSYDNRNNYNRIKDVDVWVLDIEWISTDVENFRYRIREEGNYQYYRRMECGECQSEKEIKRGEKVDTIKTQYLYKCKWVVGTNFIYDEERVRNVITEGKKRAYKPEISYNIFNLKSDSMVSRMIPFADDVAVATFKLRNAVAKAIPSPGLIINKDALTNVTIGGVKMKPKDILDMLPQTGYLVVKELTDYGLPNAATPRAPLTPIPNTLNESINAFLTLINHNIQQIRNVTGVNEVVDASTPNPRIGKAVSQLAAASTNNALYELVDSYKYLKQDSATTALRMIQVIAKYSEVKGKYIMEGANNIKTIEIGKELAIGEYSIIVEMSTTQEEREQMLQELAAMRAARVQGGGVGGIKASTYMAITEMVRSGNIKQARYMASIAEENQRKEDMEVARANAEMNAQTQQQAAQAKMEADLMLIEAKKNAEIETSRIEEEEKRKTLMLEYDLKMRQDSNKITTETMSDSFLNTQQTRNSVVSGQGL